MSEQQPGTRNVVIGGGIVTSLALAGAGLVAFILGWEDGTPTYKPTVVYADKLAGGLPTACGGLTKHITDTPIIVGELWSAEKCQAEVERAVVKVQLRLAKCFTREPPQSVFDAATSHAWNVGAPSTCASGAMQAWNRGDWRLGCQRLYQSDAGKPVWSYVKTGRKLPDGRPEMKFVQGLQNRRQAEYRMCIEGVQ
ncbi:MAG: glycoside hydrolase family protein [Rhodobacteraceae bacterium]|nr:glycoside hydrolase family protein [Paracoccaceae bacterium]